MLLKYLQKTAQVPKQVQLRGSWEKSAQGYVPEEGEGFRIVSMPAGVVSLKWETVLTHVSFREITSGHAKAEAKEQE